MKIKIKGTGLNLTPAIQEYIEDKIGALEKFVQSIERDGGELLARVEIARTTRHHEHGDVFRAEVNIDRGKNIARAEHEDYDIRVAIDHVHTVLKRLLVKYKEKR